MEQKGSISLKVRDCDGSQLPLLEAHLSQRIGCRLLVLIDLSIENMAHTSELPYRMQTLLLNNIPSISKLIGLSLDSDK